MLKNFNYVCPNCLNSLKNNIDYYYCESCHKKYEINNGIPIFSNKKNYYWHPIKKERMNDILVAMPKIGWENAFSKILSYLPSDEVRAQYCNIVLNESRAGFKYLLNLPSHGNVLDIG